MNKKQFEIIIANQAYIMIQNKAILDYILPKKDREDIADKIEKMAKQVTKTQIEFAEKTKK